jgi:hypothetical protein
MDQPSQSEINPTDPAQNIPLSDIYIQALTTMRSTDDISLRLLAAVPVVSGIGITLLVRQPTSALPDGAKLFLSTFAALVTFAIYRWERRNMSHCRHLRGWAAELESRHLDKLRSAVGIALRDAPHGDNSSGRFLSKTWGKTQAELLLYLTAIVSWLATGIYAAII